MDIRIFYTFIIGISLFIILYSICRLEQKQSISITKFVPVNRDGCLKEGDECVCMNTAWDGICTIRGTIMMCYCDEAHPNYRYC